MGWHLKDSTLSIDTSVFHKHRIQDQALTYIIKAVT